MPVGGGGGCITTYYGLGDQQVANIYNKKAMIKSVQKKIIIRQLSAVTKLFQFKQQWVAARQVLHMLFCVGN